MQNTKFAINMKKEDKEFMGVPLPQGESLTVRDTNHIRRKRMIRIYKALNPNGNWSLTGSIDTILNFVEDSKQLRKSIEKIQ